MLTRHHCIFWVVWVLQRCVLWNLLLYGPACIAIHEELHVLRRGNGNQCQEDDSKDMSKRNERLLTPLDIHQTIRQCNCFSVSKLRMGSINRYPLSAREMLGRSLNENVTYNMVNLHLLQKLVWEWRILMSLAWLWCILFSPLLVAIF